MYKNLKRLRESLKMTQKDFANSLSLGVTTYNGYETGAREPKSDFWIAVAKKYGVTIDYLMGYSDDPHKTSGNTVKFPYLSHDAISIAHKYDDLDEHGKKMVGFVLDEEIARLHKEIEESTPIISLIKYRTPASAGRGIPLDSVQDWDRMEVISNAYTRKADYCISVSGNSMEPKFYDGDMLLVKEQDDIDFGEVGVFLVNGEGYIKQKGEHYLISLNRNVPNVYIGDGDDIVCEGLVIGILDPDWIKK